MNVKKFDSNAEPICVSIADAQRILGIGKNKTYQIGAESGAMFKLGKRTLFRVDKLKAYIEQISEG